MRSFRTQSGIQRTNGYEKEGQRSGQANGFGRPRPSGRVNRSAQNSYGSVKRTRGGGFSGRPISNHPRPSTPPSEGHPEGTPYASPNPLPTPAPNGPHVRHEQHPEGSPYPSRNPHPTPAPNGPHVRQQNPHEGPANAPRFFQVPSDGYQSASHGAPRQANNGTPAAPALYQMPSDGWRPANQPKHQPKPTPKVVPFGPTAFQTSRHGGGPQHTAQPRWSQPSGGVMTHGSSAAWAGHQAHGQAHGHQAHGKNMAYRGYSNVATRGPINESTTLSVMAETHMMNYLMSWLPTVLSDLQIWDVIEHGRNQIFVEFGSRTAVMAARARLRNSGLHCELLWETTEEEAMFKMFTEGMRDWTQLPFLQPAPQAFQPAHQAFNGHNRRGRFRGRGRRGRGGVRSNQRVFSTSSSVDFNEKKKDPNWDVCWNFMKPGGCRRGDLCRWRHIRPSEKENENLFVRKSKNLHHQDIATKTSTTTGDSESNRQGFPKTVAKESHKTDSVAPVEQRKEKRKIRGHGLTPGGPVTAPPSVLGNEERMENAKSEDQGTKPSEDQGTKPMESRPRIEKSGRTPEGPVGPTTPKRTHVGSSSSLNQTPDSSSSSTELESDQSSRRGRSSRGNTPQLPTSSGLPREVSEPAQNGPYACE